MLFNDQQAILNTSMITDHTLIVDVTKTLTDNPTNKIYMYNKDGECTEYNFKTLVPEPVVTSLSNEFAKDGETVTLKGDYLLDYENAHLKITFPGNVDVTDFKSISKSAVTFVVPEGAQKGFVTVESMYGKGKYKFYFRDDRCILFDWQYNLLSTLDYFYRPVRWYATRWYYPVYDHYRIGYYYYTRPNIYITYHGCTWHRRRPDRPSPYASWRPRRGAGMHGYGPATPPPPPHNHHGHHNRPDNNYNWPDRPYNNNSGNYGRPGRPNNNNNISGARPAFRDTYINYRQTGHDTPQRGTGRPTDTRSGRGFGQR